MTARAVVTGAPQELAFLLTTALDLQPSDRVVLQAPLYEGLTAVATASGCVVDWWQPRVVTSGSDSGGLTLSYDVSNLEALLEAPGASPPALVAFNFPHAPTGATLTAAALARAVAAARSAGARCVLSDEMYRELAGDVLPVAAAMVVGKEDETAVVSLGGLSKWAGCPGLRTGWLTFNTPSHPLLTRVRELRDFTSVCPPSVTESLALGALRAAPLLAARGRALVNAGDASLTAFQGAHSHYFGSVAPSEKSAGSTRLLHLATGEPAAAFCERAMARAGVLLLPATAYPACPPSLAACVRVGIGRAGLPAALDALSSFVRGSPMRV